jgi:steroid delta-isomerase-like uncharacterized protein
MPMDLRDAIRRYNEAWNAHDVAAILAMHTDDSVFENHTSGGKAVGRAAIGEIVQSVFASLPDIRFSTRRLYVGPDFVVQEWTATATAPGSAAPPRTIVWDGVDVIPFVDGKVARKDVYTDSLSFRRQMSGEAAAG